MSAEQIGAEKPRLRPENLQILATHWKSEDKVPPHLLLEPKTMVRIANGLGESDAAALNPCICEAWQEADFLRGSIHVPSTIIL